MSPLTELPNIGPTLAEKLDQIGVTTFDELVEIGNIEALIQIGQTDKSTCYNMLYALEGAIRGIRWHLIPKVERSELRTEFDRQVDS